jgi:hypothetical protein
MPKQIAHQPRQQLGCDEERAVFGRWPAQGELPAAARVADRARVVQSLGREGDLRREGVQLAVPAQERREIGRGLSSQEY